MMGASPLRSCAAGAAVLIALLLLGPAATAAPSKYLIVSFTASGSQVSLASLKVVEDTPFYEGIFISSEPLPESGYSARLSDSSGKALFTASVSPGVGNPLPFSPEAVRIEVLFKGEQATSQRIEFCDRDGACEPCGNQGPDGSCRLVENALTCADCQRGGADGMCDLFKDGVCDPDCDSLDSDCPGCASRACLSRDDERTFTSCAGDLGGEVCRAGVGCTGRFAYADDAGSLCCVGGICIYEREPPQCESLGGRFCWADEWCTGGVMRPDPTGYTCCIGGECVPLKNASGKANAPSGVAQVFSGKRGFVLLIAGEMALLVALVALIRRGRR